MQLSNACTSILNQLEDILRQLDEADFTRPSASLSKSTIGQHIRHTLEFFLCLEEGFKIGVVNYDKRAHDKLIETDKFIALNAIQRIGDFIINQKHDHALKLEVGYERDSEECLSIQTNYFRELTYNIEHAVHHMAIMKIGLREVAPYVTFPSDFGVAISTIRHQEAMVIVAESE
ncbi:MAG: DinB family protein [Cyclobacteriaceae bacterium]|nr:DinB family protein [Cyclobacteriaceae bacterium]